MDDFPLKLICVIATFLTLIFVVVVEQYSPRLGEFLGMQAVFAIGEVFFIVILSVLFSLWAQFKQKD